MGDHKFRLSKMIPNAWFNKLKDMTGKTSNRSGNGNRNGKAATPLKEAFEPRRYSYRFNTAEPNRNDQKLFCNSPINPKGSDTHFPLHDLPKKSSTSRNFKRKSMYRPSPCRLAASSSSFSPRCSYRATLNSFSFTDSSSGSEVLVEERHLLELDDYNTNPPQRFNLAPTTKKVTKTRTSSLQPLEKSRISIKVIKKEHSPDPVLARTSSIKSTKGVKLRKHATKLARKSVSSASTTKSGNFTGSFAVVKNSNDPERDFKDSMMEMIVENDIRASKDLEELLACYLLLNSNEYHHLIVKAFEHILFDMVEDRI